MSGRITDRAGRSTLVAALLVAGLVFTPVMAQDRRERDVLNVLFIVNSQGFSNNLGDIVAGIAAADPLGPIIVPTMTLERGGARSLLEGGSWDYVIYQIVALLPGNYEPPTLPIWPEPEREFKMGSVEEFHKIVRELDRLGRAAGAKMILFPSPPRRLARFDADFLPVWEDIWDAHVAIAREIRADVAPIPAAFEEVRERLISLPVFMYDGSHPSDSGSYLEGLIFYSMISGRSPEGAPQLIYGRPIAHPKGKGFLSWHVNDNLRVPLVDLPVATAMELQRIARDVVSQRERTNN